MHSATAITLVIGSMTTTLAVALYVLGNEVVGMFLGGIATLTLMGAFWNRDRR